ncbi:MAG: hypothetical protein B9S32_10800 [Verrucomicrobia bacterium Tous-C9LFEB]|nr:MAG: hypothetical protein B9S32_10800 [Verrucomicrobia bacterium Tous-C9LFEB]
MQSNRQARKGFSLVELLVVMAVMGMVATLSITGFNSIVQAHTVSRGVYDVASLLELARSQAIARQTYVWVGFQSVAGSSGQELQMVAFYSVDGTGTNTASTNLLPLSKVLRVKNVSLVEWNSLKESTRNLVAGQNPSSVATNVDGIPLSAGPIQFKARTTVTFTPRGESMLKGAAGITDGYNTWIDVSFRQAYGNSIRPNADDGAVLVNGATGAVRPVILR